MTQETQVETQIETKMLPPEDDFAATFAAFRAANDERLEAIEKKSADPLLEEKVNRLNKRLETLSINLASGTSATTETKSAASTAWDRFIRSGDETGLIELKSLSSTDGDGGYVVPLETESRIDQVLADASTMRSIATVRQTGSGQFRKPVSVTDAATGWVAEDAARSETTAPELKLLEFPAGELYAMPAATQALLDDAVADVDGWLAQEVRDVFAAQETAAFVTGDGSNKPRGFLDYQSETRKLTEEITGEAGGFQSGSEFETLVNLIYSNASRYRPNSTFVMNRRTLAEVRKIKDGSGRYIWEPSGQAGQPSQLLGYPVVEMEDMPEMSAAQDPFAIAFGDFRRGYLIADRQGVRVLRDPYSAKPYVLFYTTKRVGGGVQDFDAITLLKFAAE